MNKKHLLLSKGFTVILDTIQLVCQIIWMNIIIHIINFNSFIDTLYIGRLSIDKN